MPTAKKKASPKKKAAAKLQVLNTALFIPVVKEYEQDGKKHILGGRTYPAGTVVSQGMKEAYEASAALVGGTTPFEKFCLTTEAAAPIEIAIEEDEE